MTLAKNVNVTMPDNFLLSESLHPTTDGNRCIDPQSNIRSSVNPTEDEIKEFRSHVCQGYHKRITVSTNLGSFRSQ